MYQVGGNDLVALRAVAQPLGDHDRLPEVISLITDRLPDMEADADSKAKSARTAMLFSRTNTLLSIPMLFAMVSAQNIY